MFVVDDDAVCYFDNFCAASRRVYSAQSREMYKNLLAAKCSFLFAFNMRATGKNAVQAAREDVRQSKVTWSFCNTHPRHATLRYGSRNRYACRAFEKRNRRAFQFKPSSFSCSAHQPSPSLARLKAHERFIERDFSLILCVDSG